MLRVPAAVGEQQLLGISVIGGDDHATARGHRRIDDAPDRAVGRGHRGAGRPEVAGVSDHVGVREVHDREVVGTTRDGLHQRVGDARGAHLGAQVVGGDLGRGHEHAVLAGERRLAAAVEEIRHVSVLLRLGGVELLQARLR